jgi:uncharacterized membrane-anchored protein
MSYEAMFPNPHSSGVGLRDWLACEAMKSLLGQFLKNYKLIPEEANELAEHAYWVANAMLRARADR